MQSILSYNRILSFLRPIQNIQEGLSVSANITYDVTLTHNIRSDHFSVECREFTRESLAKTARPTKNEYRIDPSVAHRAPSHYFFCRGSYTQLRREHRCLI